MSKSAKGNDMHITNFKISASEIIKSFIVNEDAATAIEYGLIAGLVATAIVSGVTSLGEGIDDQFNKINGHLAENSPPEGGAIPINIPPSNFN